VARLLALALRLEQLVQSGAVADYAALAALSHVSRARITQILNLRLLAPDLQETLLFLPCTQRGRDPVPLRQLQPLAALLDWHQQRLRWGALRAACPELCPESCGPSRGLPAFPPAPFSQ
jgi:hypothetical protein